MSHRERRRAASAAGVLINEIFINDRSLHGSEELDNNEQIQQQQAEQQQEEDQGRDPIDQPHQVYEDEFDQSQDDIQQDDEDPNVGFVDNFEGLPSSESSASFSENSSLSQDHLRKSSAPVYHNSRPQLPFFTST